ncbi:unnamed protein product [Auanema sp. JU1783]|nr:unnamed protein product [Auanema sp. JU1783]
MFFSRALRGNLNRRHWNRKVFEIGYRGPLLPQQKVTGRPDLPIYPDKVVTLRDRLNREFGVMSLLARPYVTEVVEQDYFEHLNVKSLEELREREVEEQQAKKMPGKEKRIEGSKVSVRRRANIGNSLHKNTTIEDSLSSLIQRNRWD